MTDLIYGGLSARELGLSVCTREETPTKTLARASAVSDRTALGVAAVYGESEDTASETFILASDGPIYPGLAAAVADWLAPSGYRELVIGRGGESFSYRARVSELSSTSVGGETRYFTVKFELAEPYALGAEKAVSVSTASGGSVSAAVLTAGRYAYPTIAITGSGEITLTNATDDALRGSAKTFRVTGVTPGETITADCARRTIATTEARNIHAAFTGDWPRLLRGENTLTVTTTGSAVVTVRWRETARV